MDNLLNVELSPELEQCREQIEATVKPFIDIYPQKNEKLTLWQSKLGGLPYLPKGCKYPKDAQGNLLFLLAQINFEEVPCLEGFPRHGILQFYIAQGNAYGADFDNPTQQNGFRVVYFPVISKTEDGLVTDFSFLPKPEELPLFGTSCSLQFEKKMGQVGIRDYEFKELLGEDFFAQFGANRNHIMDEYTETFASEGHKMGGYAYFTQDDPRPRVVAGDKYILLLQLDTDSDAEIMWGDSGVGNFFISQTDLEQLDFSKVLYNWDCL